MRQTGESTPRPESAISLRQIPKLTWQMQSPDGRKLVDNRKHAAQFSVSTRLTGDVLYGVNNFLGFGNFFGQIGEIRISNTRRY